jgi:peptide/nickel transport system ATP-binding protein
MTPLLEVKDLRVFYRAVVGARERALVKAVDGVSLTIEKKEILGIVGESGCGKSTLAMGTLNLTKPPCYIAEGEVILDGLNLRKLNEEEMRRIRLKRFSYIPQSSMNALNPIMRIRGQIMDGIMAHENLRKVEAEEMVPFLIERVGLPPEAAAMYPHELSGGMRQRAVIAIALSLNPELLIADEPTTALDVVLQRVVLEFLVSLRDRRGTSLMIISHDVAVQAEVCDRLAVMYAGKIVEIGKVYGIFRNAFHPYTRGLLDSVPSIKDQKKLRGLSGSPPNLINPPAGCRFHPRCSKASAKCKVEEPLLRTVGPGHFTACHLY